MNSILKAIKTYAEMIKISHTVFALPFALSAVVIASRYQNINFIQFLWVILAMTGARAAAMGFNRIVDRKIDKKNPRTKEREIPSGKISLVSAYFFWGISSALFVFSAFMLGMLCFYLSFPVLFILCFYSYTKKFTPYAHLYLGFAISLAPAGAFTALTNSMNTGIIFLSITLLTYISGFDILYSCQDIDFDKKEGLYSIPVRFGEKKAFLISDILHIVSFLSLFIVYWTLNMGYIFLFSIIIIGALFMGEHLVVRPYKMEKINIAFFHINSVISIILFAGIFIDELCYKWL
ncbi:MAG: 4-hydroxybenzoate octaprenyltransferase [Deltaproteobacteria bacterium]|nr:MAG: 4-hydroxybenzoate octaprenyltransferase [Deltaproteobacteria bacterium]